MMLALALFAGAGVAGGELLQRAQAASNDGENVLVASFLAQRRLEELQNDAYASLASESNASIADPTGFSQYSREVTVTTPYANLKQVVVTVYWSAGGGQTSVSLQTYRSDS